MLMNPDRGDPNLTFKGAVIELPENPGNCLSKILQANSIHTCGGLDVRGPELLGPRLGRRRLVPDEDVSFRIPLGRKIILTQFFETI